MMANKNKIIKIAKGNITLLAKNDIRLKAKEINSFSDSAVNETGKKGVAFKP